MVTSLPDFQHPFFHNWLPTFTISIFYPLTCWKIVFQDLYSSNQKNHPRPQRSPKHPIPNLPLTKTEEGILLKLLKPHSKNPSMMEMCQLQKGDRSEVEMKRWSRAIGRGGPTKPWQRRETPGKNPTTYKVLFSWGSSYSSTPLTSGLFGLLNLTLTIWPRYMYTFFWYLPEI